MRKVGIKEFRDNATKLLATGETMLIERHGHPVGYFIPVKKKDEAEAESAEKRFTEALEDALSKTHLTQDELADLFIIKRDRASIVDLISDKHAAEVEFEVERAQGSSLQVPFPE